MKLSSFQSKQNNNQPRNFLFHKTTKSVAIVICLSSLIATGYGVYSLKKNDINPRDGWSERFTATRKEIKNLPTFDMAVAKKLKVSHKITTDAEEDPEKESEETSEKKFHKIGVQYIASDFVTFLANFNFYENDIDAKYDYYVFACRINDNDRERYDIRLNMTTGSVDGKIYTFFVITGTYSINKKTTISAELASPAEVIGNYPNLINLESASEILITILKGSEITFDTEGIIKPNTVLYNLFKETNDLVYTLSKAVANLIITAVRLFVSFPCANIDSYLSDLNNITATQANNIQTGKTLLFVAIPFFFLALTLALLPFIYSHSAKKQNQKVLAINNESIKSIKKSTPKISTSAKTQKESK